MNQEQMKAAVRYGIAIIGAGFAGWVGKSGYVTSEQVSSVLNSETFISAAVAIGMGIWGVIARSTSNLIATTALLPEVSAVHLVDPQLAKDVRADLKGEKDPARVVTKP